ncbi:MAG: anthranilate phosphoribosyltransferase, partial [Halobacteria archaeon]|nr:anthranilate phosphoribosyltransferase [Halobacteria archaeon]
TNPADATSQVVGVYDPDLVGKLARVLALMDVERALVVHGSGLDEIGLHGETTVAEMRGDDVDEYTVEPADLGLEEQPIEDVAGGSPEENARYLQNIFNGKETGARRDIVLANSMEEGVEVARNAIDEGKTTRKLEQLAETQ